MAVFGAPEPFPAHADRAVRAAVEMAARVNRSGDDGFRIGVGVNTGRVVAGNIGGAGRLNFSVIGDPVNVASRTESATRRTGDAVLITAETARRLSSDFGLTKRHAVSLKGIDEPMTLYAPAVPDVAAIARGDGHAETIGTGVSTTLGGRPDRSSTLPGA
jgi:adenylate cyclase